MKGDDVLVSNGVLKPIKPMNGQYYTLQELQHYVGGYIETLTFSNGKVLVFDEEGKLKGRPVNRIATAWITLDGLCDFIAGDAVLIDGEHFK